MQVEHHSVLIAVTYITVTVHSSRFYNTAGGDVRMCGRARTTPTTPTTPRATACRMLTWSTQPQLGRHGRLKSWGLVSTRLWLYVTRSPATAARRAADSVPRVPPPPFAPFGPR